MGIRRSGDRIGCESTDLRQASQDKLFEVVVDPLDAVGDGDMAPQFVPMDVPSSDRTEGYKCLHKLRQNQIMIEVMTA